MIEPQFVMGNEFRNGRARVVLNGGLFYEEYVGDIGYIDRLGKPISKATYKTGGDFSDNLATVKLGEHFGFIDRNGSWVIEPQFSYAREFSEELAAVAIDGKFGFIEKTGTVVIKPQFEDAQSFSEGLARSK